jgi:hypothetical protein
MDSYHSTLLEEKSFTFALRIIKLSNYLKKEHLRYLIISFEMELKKRDSRIKDMDLKNLF